MEGRRGAEKSVECHKKEMVLLCRFSFIAICVNSLSVKILIRKLKTDPASAVNGNGAPQHEHRSKQFVFFLIFLDLCHLLQWSNFTEVKNKLDSQD